MHIVHFDSSQKIQQVRLYWDQGSLLKLIDVIGSRGRNWPIRDGKEQARLIASSAADLPQSIGLTRLAMENISQDMDQTAFTTKPRSQSKNVTRDPHASLALFAPRDEEQDPSPPTTVARRASAKPPPRDYHDLFVGNESDASPVTREKLASPKKENMTPGPIAPKGGAGKNYQPSRLFETDKSQPGTPTTPVESSSKFIKPDPKKFNHFEFGDGNDEQQPMAARPKSKHQNNWDFADFVTPDKVPTKIRGQHVRHFGWSDDEPVMDSPLKHPATAKPRPDADTNFDFHDKGISGPERHPNHSRGQASAQSCGVYQTNVFDENDLLPSAEKKGRPLANLKDRRKNFDPQFSMTDKSPSQPTNINKQPITEARAKVVQQMGAQWEASDQSPVSHLTGKSEDMLNLTSGDKENILSGGSNKHIGIKSSGDGMGGKKGAGLSWGFGDDSPSLQPAGKNQNRGNPTSGDNKNVSNGDGKTHVGIKNGGDGMGGKKGAGRSWGFGDDSDEDGAGGINGGKFQASKIQQTQNNTAFWEF